MVSLARSGTHVVKTALSKYIELEIPLIQYLDLDEINFYCNSNRSNFYVTHWDYIEKWDPGKLDRFNTIIRNRNLYVVFLDRKDLTELILSRAIAYQLGWESNKKSFKNKIRLKKSILEGEYKNTIRLKYHNNLDRIPLIVHEKIFYEDIIKNGLIINNEKIPLDLGGLAEEYENSVIKNPPKNESISNYDQVLKWLDEFSKIYNENWEPYIKWGK